MRKIMSRILRTCLATIMFSPVMKSESVTSGEWVYNNNTLVNRFYIITGLMQISTNSFPHALFKKLGAIVTGILSAIIVTLAFTGCSDDNEEFIPDLQDCTVSMKVSYLVEGNNNQIDKVEIYVLDDSDTPEPHFQPVNEEWSQTVHVSDVSNAFGLMATPSISSDINDKEEVSFSVSARIEIDLNYNSQIIDKQIVEADDVIENPFTDSGEVADLRDIYLFRVADGKIQRIPESELNGQDEEEAPSLPLKDEEKVKSSGNLYFISQAEVDEDQFCLHDNILSRFLSHTKWDGHLLGKRDFLYVKASELNGRISSIKESIANGCILILDDVSTLDELKGICNALELYCATESSEDIANSIFLLGDPDTPFIDESGQSFGGIYFKLSPMSSGLAISDYFQGEVVDKAVACINNLLMGSDVKSASRSGDDNLTSIVNAYKVWETDYHTLVKSDYRGSYAAEEQTNIYNIEYDIWHVYSITEARNYYYIHQEFMGTFSPCYKGVRKTLVKTNGCNTMAKVSEYYGDYVTITTIPKCQGLQIHRNSPSTTLGSTTYTSGFSWDLSGELSYDGKVGGTVHTGISLSFSESYNKEDLTVSNNCVPGNKLEWTFNLTRPRAKFHPFYVAGSDMIEGALLGRTSMTTGMDYIISCPATNPAPQMQGIMKVGLRSSAAKCGSICGEREKEDVYYYIIKLPIKNS